MLYPLQGTAKTKRSVNGAAYGAIRSLLVRARINAVSFAIVFSMYVVGTKCPRGGFEFRFTSPERRRVAEAGQGILTNMFEHVDA